MSQQTALFDVDASAPPYSRNYALVTANDTPVVDLVVAGLLATDVIQQVSFTAKLNASDADNAPTTVQHIWQPPNGSTGPQVVAIDSGTYTVAMPLTQADTGKLAAVHGYDVRLWVLRSGITYVRTVQQGQIITYTGWTTQAIPVGGALANEDGTLLCNEAYA